VEVLSQEVLSVTMYLTRAFTKPPRSLRGIERPLYDDGRIGSAVGVRPRADAPRGLGRWNAPKADEPVT
jgi:hypothetical protein